MPFQPQERPQREADVVSLRRLQAGLAPLHPTVLLQVPVVVLDREAQLGVVLPHARLKAEVIADPVFRTLIS